MAALGLLLTGSPSLFGASDVAIPTGSSQSSWLHPWGGAYVNMGYDAGQVFGRFEEVRFQGLRHAWGVALALDTPLGPLSFGYGLAEAKYDRLYINLGYDF